MSRARWWVVGAVGLVVAAAVAVVAWSLTDGDGDPSGHAASLTRIDLDSSGPYAFPVWWTDGRTPIKLGDAGGKLKVVDPVAAWERVSDPRAAIELPGGEGTHPAAFAALPGEPGGPWVAVSLPAKDVGLDDLTTTERPLVWTGTALATVDAARAGKPFELPTELRSNESNGAVAVVDAAVARLGSEDVAVVTTRQRDDAADLDVAGISVCRLSDCRWRDGASAGDTAIEAVGSTGAGFVGVSDVGSKQATIWYADDADLTWRRIGASPRGMRLQVVQDGPGSAALVWRADDDIAIQTVRRGELRTAAQRAHLDDRLSQVSTAIERDGTWLLGGSRFGTARIELSYRAGTPVLWERRGKTWHADDDLLLDNQPDQEIEALFTDRQDRLRAVSSSAVQRIHMTWRFSRAKD